MNLTLRIVEVRASDLLSRFSLVHKPHHNLLTGRIMLAAGHKTSQIFNYFRDGYSGGLRGVLASFSY